MLNTINEDLVPLLMETGFLAADTGRIADAKNIFIAVANARPDNANPQIGLAYAEMNSNNNLGAIQILNNAIAKNPKEISLCKCFLGMALKNIGRYEESRSVLREVLEVADNNTAVNLAKDLLYGS